MSGVVTFLNNTPVRWLCKRQPTVKTSTYGSEMVTAQVSTEMLMELRYQLRMLGVTLEGPTHMYGDNKSVVLNGSTPSSILKKKHLSLAYNRVREASAVGILVFSAIWSEENVANVLTKPLGGTEF